MKILYTVNAGLFLSSGQTALMIDGIHEGQSVGFSAMPEGLEEQILQAEGVFSQLDGLLFTHLHKDHYDEEIVSRVLQKRPGIALWGPGLNCRGVQEYHVIPGGCEFWIGEFRISAYITIHSAEEFKEDPHRSFLIWNETTEETIFVSGDAVFSADIAESIRERIGTETRIDAAFINVFHLIEEPSRDFLLRLAPDRLLLYHRPLPEDDKNHYLSMIHMALRRYMLPGHMIEQPEHMQWVSGFPQ